MDMHLLFYKRKRLPSYVFIESILCIFFGLLIFSSLFQWIVERNMVQNKERNQESSRRNIVYLLSQIQEELLYAKWGTADFKPLDHQTGSLLSFRTGDQINLIRFYKTGYEVGKDTNTTGYNAITQKTLKTFDVTREDLENFYFLTISIQDIYGFCSKRSYVEKKTF